MAKYLLTGTSLAAGTKGLIAGGGSVRRKAIQDMMQGVGGKVEAYYFAFGAADVAIIIAGPNNVTAAAVSLAVNSSDLAAVKTTPLITPEEPDQGGRKPYSIAPPGSSRPPREGPRRTNRRVCSFGRGHASYSAHARFCDRFLATGPHERRRRA
jgi:uncharacterized protein with GYD domain